MKLHYSQTMSSSMQTQAWFYYLMKLHYSQTLFCGSPQFTCFTTLWNYTTLKRNNSRNSRHSVLLPYEITLLSNLLVVFIGSSEFYYLMKLHYSQTFGMAYSQLFSFYYLMKLHYSQTISAYVRTVPCFTTLWNYTTLKPHNTYKPVSAVLLPYEITLLSNYPDFNVNVNLVLLPYEITLLSNRN